jgi:DNA-directed RNA polymerase specialized sigma54-like protein
MSRGKIVNRLNDAALIDIVESLRNSGRVLNLTAIANLAGVHKGTVNRRLRTLGLFSQTRIEPSNDKEPRTWEEISKLIQLAINREDKNKPLSYPKLVIARGLACDWQIVCAVRWRYDIPNSRQRKKAYLGQ